MVVVCTGEWSPESSCDCGLSWLPWCWSCRYRVIKTYDLTRNVYVISYVNLVNYTGMCNGVMDTLVKNSVILIDLNDIVFLASLLYNNSVLWTPVQVTLVLTWEYVVFIGNLYFTSCLLEICTFYFVKCNSSTIYCNVFMYVYWVVLCDN